MSRIDIENAKRIRTPFEVYAGFASRTETDLTFTATTVAAADSDIDTSLDGDGWAMRNLTDLQGGGFSLDGTAKLYDPTLTASSDNGKVGIRTNIGAGVDISINAAAQIAAVTIAIAKGQGTITANGTNYAIRRLVVIPVNSTSINISFANSLPGERIEISSITPGIVLDFNASNIINCTLGLRSDLSFKPTWQVSDIEIQAYYPDDLSEAISNVGDYAPIWYYAGYPEDYSPIRYFYLSEPAQMENGIITLKGEDASSLLEAKNNISQVIASKAGNGRATLYNRFLKFITDAGVKLINQESAPANTSGTTDYTLIIEEVSSRDAVADIMNLAHNGSFWPTYVDAGIPTAYHTKPQPKWDIYEADCGDVVRVVDRNIGKIATDNEEGLHSNVTRSTTLQTLEAFDIVYNQVYSLSPEGWWWYLAVTKGKNILATADSIMWTATTGTGTRQVNVNGQIVEQKVDQSIVTGKACILTVENQAIVETNKRPGTTLEVDPIARGKIYGGTTKLYPNYAYLFDRSNITGSLKTKGDPRWQPRDIFNFHRLDGTVEQCTMQDITLVHEGGGTYADITYRKGIC